MAKTAEKYNRRNLIDLLDKMDYQIVKLKGIMPLLALQSAVIVITFVCIMHNKFDKTYDAAYKAGKLAAGKHHRG